MGNPTLWHITVWLTLTAMTAAGYGAERRISIPTVKNAAASQVFMQQVAEAGRCYAANIGNNTAGTLVLAKPEVILPAGRYRLHIPLALAPLGSLHTSAIAITLTAGDTRRTIGMLDFARADEFIDFTLDISAPGGRDIPISVAWTISGELARRNQQAALPDVQDPEEDSDKETPDLSFSPAVDENGMIAENDLSQITYHLAARGLHLEPISPVVITRVSTDKIVYRPGEAGKTAVILRNDGPDNIRADVHIVLRSELTSTTELATVPIEIPAGGSREWAGTFNTDHLHWGAEIAAVVGVADFPPVERSVVFGVTENFWETAIVRGMLFTADYVEPAAAESFMDNAKENGYTVQESGFWAPDEFGDFTPDPACDLFFGGQGGYPGSVKGTKNVIASAHKRGIAATVYADLWGGDGANTWEMCRKHPEWFEDEDRADGACTDMIENWSLQHGRHTFGTWPFSLISRTNGDGALKVHARELIDSHRQFGWDGVRYDSYYSDSWVKAATKAVREIVEAEEPEYRWGYNSLVPKDVAANALDVMCRGGQLVMTEGLRAAGITPMPFTRYEDTLATYRETVWSFGGHHGVCYDTPNKVAGEKGTDLDAIYLCSILLACGTHPYYSRMIGDYPRFALRYSEFLFNNAMRPLKNPDAVIRLTGDPQLMDWKRLARRLDLGNDRHRLVIHLINPPVDDMTMHNLALKTNPPLRNLDVSLTLPAGAKVTGGWALCGYPAIMQQALQISRANDTMTITVPVVRFWTMLVVDYTAKEGI